MSKQHVTLHMSCPLCGMKVRADRIFPKGFDPEVTKIEVKADIITSGGRGKIKHEFRNVTGYLETIKDSIILKCEAIIEFIKGDNLWPTKNLRKVSPSYLMGRSALGVSAYDSTFLRQEMSNLISPSVLRTSGTLS